MSTTVSMPQTSPERERFKRAVWRAIEDLTLPIGVFQSKYDNDLCPDEIRAICKKFYDDKITADEARSEFLKLLENIPRG